MPQKAPQFECFNPFCLAFSARKPQQDLRVVEVSGYLWQHVPVSGGKGFGPVTVPLPCSAGARGRGLLPLVAGKATGLS